MLSKSKYLRGIKCRKNLWLYVNMREEQHYSEDNLMIFSRGTSVGELAQKYFPNARLAVESGEMPCKETALLTQEFIDQGVETICEATFIYDNTIVAVDLLHKEEDGWHLYEVKSTNSTKETHVKDVAVQYYVLKGCGLEISDASVMHFDRSYLRKGALDVRGLFTSDSVLKQILPMQEIIKANIPEFHALVEKEEPMIEMGNHCSTPYDCDFRGYCSSMLLLKEEEEVIKQILSSTPQVNTVEIKRFLDNVTYPICHLDFETIMPGVPLFDNSRSYQQIPFQYSMHCQNSKSEEIIHSDYLAPSDLSIDPRKGLIEQMIVQTKEAKTILVYNIAFERTRINEMIRDFPEYALELQTIVDRLIDLMTPFRKQYRTESMEGRYSIKKVLPALCPELSYYDLEIGNGMDASNAYLELYYCEDKEYVNTTREHLLKYCHLDTLAMVKVFEVLEKV